MGKRIIIGAGLTGLSAAYHLKENYEIFEKEDKVGGLARSFEIDDFTFDYAGHIFFTKNEYVMSLVKKLLGDNINFKTRKSWIYYKGIYTRYPFQANTFGLPVNVVKECVIKFIEAKFKKKKVSENFEEWIYYTFGEGIAKHFMIPYNLKVWTIPLNKIDYEWVQERIPKPTIGEVIEGALHLQRKNFGYNTKFGYPSIGGCEAIPSSFLRYVKNINLKKEIVKIYPKEKFLITNSGEKIYFDKIISTIPLPELVKMMEDVPLEVNKSSKSLKYVSVLCINLGINRPNISDKHWIYYPEKKFIFHRNFIQSNASPFVVPKGTSSLILEISYSPNKRVNKKNIIIDRVVNDLIKAKFLTKKDKILASNTIDIKYAYVVYDKNRKKNVEIIHKFLRKNNIYPVGRYAEWEYYNMDQSILRGKEIALELNKDYGKTKY